MQSRVAHCKNPYRIQLSPEYIDEISVIHKTYGFIETFECGIVATHKVFV